MTVDGKPKDALCVCEYDDIDGQRQHVLAMCCDCDALDVACDRCSSRSCTTLKSLDYNVVMTFRFNNNNNNNNNVD